MNQMLKNIKNKNNYYNQQKEKFQNQILDQYQKQEYERQSLIQGFKIRKNNLFFMIFIIIIASSLPNIVAGQDQPIKNQQNNIIKNIQPSKQQVVNYIPAQIVTDPNQIPAEQIIEVQKEAQLTQNKKDELQPWIREQMEQMNIEVDLPISQTFQFIINEGEQLIYKWNPSKNKELKMVVNVFSVGRLGDLEVMRSSEQNQYMQILTKNPNKAIFTHLGKVYSSKVFTVDFDTDYKYLKFVNKNDQKALISIDIQKLEYVVQKGVQDQLLSQSNQKMNLMLDRTKSSQIKLQHMYKWQWGYLQNEQLHQMKILGFSGIELFTIIVTALIQMYSIKNLLDNRAVV